MTMEVNYGVAITNKFALFLNEDEDPLDILRLQEENKTKKVDKKDKDAKTKVKSSKVDSTATAAADQKKPAAATATSTLKKDDKAPIRPRAKPVAGEPAVAGKENDAPRRERRDDAGFRPRPQSGAPRDGVARDGFSRPERTGEQGERGGFQSRPMRGPRPQRFDRGGFTERGERGERPDFGFGGEKPEEGAEGARHGEFRRGGGRGRGGVRGGFRGGKREFDRHSGSDRSGVKPQEKRDGAGAHNWGTISDDIQEGLNANPPTEEGTTWGAQMEAAEAQPTTEGAKPEEVDAEAAAAAAEAEAAERMLTLEEWRSQQVRIKSEFNIRKAGEGCAADPQWKKMVVLTKKKDEDDEEEEDEEEEESHHGRQKTTVPIEIKFNQTATSRRGFGTGGRGGRGRGGRGGGGAPGEERRGPAAPEGDRPARGAPRVGGREQKAPQLSDELDFPSLA